MGQLDGKVALITGAASGIGRATAERFAGRRRPDLLRRLRPARPGGRRRGRRHLRAGRRRASRRDVDRAFAACELELGGVDIAYLNAGIAIGEPDITALTDDVYHRIMRVNVDGVVFGTRAAIRAMERRGGGAIVATSSLAGLIPFPPDPVYDLTKHAVVGFIRSVAPTLAPLGITANTVNPGMTDTNILTDEAKQVVRRRRLPADAGRARSPRRSSRSSPRAAPASAGSASPAATPSRTGSTTSPDPAPPAPRAGGRPRCPTGGPG